MTVTNTEPAVVADSISAAPLHEVTSRAEYDYTARPIAHGKFIYVGNKKFWAKGVTYGAFRPDDKDLEYQDDSIIEQDFAHMAASGINTVRIPHTMPPRSLLDIAQRYGLRVMVGLSAEQYAGYLIDKENAPDVEAIIREKVRSVAGHPALLCYAVGNEISAPMVRWIGRRRVERYIERIYRAIKKEDPDGLVTYVNYPTTEYLQLPFLDLVAFNVYLEAEDRLSAYLARLQNIAGERPLLMSEIGLDSIRNGEDGQAGSLEWQIRTAFSAGCAGVFVFAWTDEWYRGETAVDDWAFGLTTASREAKPALEVVTRIFDNVPFPADIEWPRFTVVVCSYNGERTIVDTLEGLKDLEYPNYEVIVVNDGSTDSTADIAARYDVRLISTENRGLSNARNTGWQEATGEYVAYIDDDAYPDPHWLHYLAWTFMHTDYIGVGGPNLAPPGDGPIAECIANAPGGPIHVLITDTEAEHIPGCNMSFRRDALAAIDGFDPRYRAAGDDVDLCWRLQDNVGKIGFNAAAMVWHHRRNSVLTYWKQQNGYGKAEALLEEKWPEKYNAMGHTSWAGRLYGNGVMLPLWGRDRVYHGVFGSTPFQSLHPASPGLLAALPMMPEWYFIVALLLTLSFVGLSWSPLLYAVPVLLVAVALPLAQAFKSASGATFMYSNRTWRELTGPYLTTVAMYIMQPIARLRGRIIHGLTPWRFGFDKTSVKPWPWSEAIWTEQWAEPESRGQWLASTLGNEGLRVVYAGPYDGWDFDIAGGVLGGVRVLTAVEDHGGGAQYIRVRARPLWSFGALASLLIFLMLFVAAVVNGAWFGGAVLFILTAIVGMRAIQESAFTMAALQQSVSELKSTLSGD